MSNLRNPSGFSAFPTEILLEIVQHTRRSDCLALCHVGDWRIHAVCIRFIYKIVYLYSADAVVKFCATIRSGTVFRDLVEALRIGLETSSSPSLSHTHRVPSALHDDPECAAACATAIGTLSKIVNLQLLNTAPLLPHLLLIPSLFPCLRTFTASFSADIGLFVRNHPSLEYIDVRGVPSRPEDGVPIDPIHLPLLQAFAGPEVLAAAVLPGSRVSTPNIRWQFRSLRNSDPSGCLASLALVSVPINVMCNIMDYWEPRAPEALVRAQPDLLSLRFRVLCRQQKLGREQAFLTALTKALPAFRRLKELVLFGVMRGVSYGIPRFMHEWDLLHLWHDRCPRSRRATCRAA
ncbi:hypothetical protein C8R43DRAFT_1155783 [Mycena crocata]|nr:hypothetical protein C8R43DRAFT_1155783 [Mycena crocata]